jgi:hypothetical protein
MPSFSRVTGWHLVCQSIDSVRIYRLDLAEVKEKVEMSRLDV